MNLWHLFTHWVVKDMLTLEERAALRAEAAYWNHCTERVKTATAIQLQRIEAERQLAEQFATVAIWSLAHWRGKGAHRQKVKTTFLLQESRNKTGNRKRRVVPGSTVTLEGNRVVCDAELGAFETSTSTYLKYVAPWHQWRHSLEAAAKSRHIEIVGEE